MTRRKPIRLFRYSRQASAARTLRTLRAAWPETDFRLVPESLGWGWNILATLPGGQGGLVQRESLALIAHNGAMARKNEES